MSVLKNKTCKYSSDSMQFTGVAVGIIIDQNRQILIAQRQKHQALASCWEFPGGKINNNESAYCALRRELREEINIHIQSAYPLINHTYHYLHGTVHLYFWHITQFTGQAQGAEGQIIRWITPEQIDKYKFPDGNQKIIEFMKNCPDKNGRLYTPTK